MEWGNSPRSDMNNTPPIPLKFSNTLVYLILAPIPARDDSNHSSRQKPNPLKRLRRKNEYRAPFAASARFPQRLGEDSILQADIRLAPSSPKRPWWVRSNTYDTLTKHLERLNRILPPTHTTRTMQILPSERLRAPGYCYHGYP